MRISKAEMEQIQAATRVQAAAPDLFAALKALRAYFGVGLHDQNRAAIRATVMQADAAIAKAEGR
jgi:hypothetical protein